MPLSGSWRYLAKSARQKNIRFPWAFEVYLATGKDIWIGEDDPEEEQLFRDLWEDETQREVMIESLKAHCVGSGREDLRVFERRMGQRICAEGLPKIL